jgi:hypothetical protein
MITAENNCLLAGTGIFFNKLSLAFSQTGKIGVTLSPNFRFPAFSRTWSKVENLLNSSNKNQVGGGNKIFPFSNSLNASFGENLKNEKKMRKKIRTNLEKWSPWNREVH